METFKAESRTLLGLMVDSIYTNRDVFLRELISNASDAIDKVSLERGRRADSFDGSSDGSPDKAPRDNSEPSNGAAAESSKSSNESSSIRISFDNHLRLLCISDNGIGMSEDELRENLGTIAHSGSKQLKDALARQDQQTANSIIGQFGVGFYSSFMVADNVKVVSRRYGSDQAFQWESNGVDGFEIFPAERANFGTDIILHIRPSTPDINYERYLDQQSLQNLIRRYSNYIRHPIVMDLADERYDENTGELLRNELSVTPTVINAMTPPWEQTDGDVPTEEAQAFYQNEFQDEDIPLHNITVRARGAIEYTALLFVPAHAPDNLFAKDHPYGLRLYSRGVLILDDCQELLPSHLRFVRGVVDTSSIDLNVSRETVQQDARMQIIARQIERSIIESLKDLMTSDRPRYEALFRLYGTGLKFAICASSGMLNDVLSPLLLYPSAKHDALISLQEYLDEAGNPKRAEIYYAAGNKVERMRKSPTVQALLTRGHDVILCPNGAQDEICFVLMGSFRGASFHSVASSNLQMDDESEATKGVAREDTSERDAVLEALHEAAPQPLARVAASRYLSAPEDAASRVSTEGAVTISMAKYLAAKARQNQGQENQESSPQPSYVLEVNCAHALFARAARAFAQSDKETLSHCARVLLCQALLAEDIPLQDPLSFNASTNALIAQANEEASDAANGAAGSDTNEIESKTANESADKQSQRPSKPRKE